MSNQVYGVGNFRFIIKHTGFKNGIYYIQIGLDWFGNCDGYLDIAASSFADYLPVPIHEYPTEIQAKKALVKIMSWIDEWLKVRGNEDKRLSFMCKIF